MHALGMAKEEEKELLIVDGLLKENSFLITEVTSTNFPKLCSLHKSKPTTQ